MSKRTNLWEYMDQKANRLLARGRKLTAGNYLKTSRRLRGFIDKDDFAVSDITEDFMADFNAYLKSEGLQDATISFYNRCLRALYNEAALEGLIKNLHPFDNVNTKVETKFLPVKVKDGKGGHVNLNEMSKEELMLKYKYLQRKYNTLVGKLSELVRA